MEPYILSQQQIDLARNRFAEIDPGNHNDAALFFQTFGPGRHWKPPNGPTGIIEQSDKPYERFSDYELLLTKLQEQDPEKYKKIHKGTPFYLMAWLAFDMRHYEKALFYLDAALSEDKKNAMQTWQDLPACRFLLLEDGNQVAGVTIQEIKCKLGEQLERFNNMQNAITVLINDFIVKVVKDLINDSKKRSIVSAFYVFLLEYDERRRELDLRSNDGGSIQPLITHLFHGGVIFESLLKVKYPGDQLGKIFQSPQFTGDFNLCNIQTSAKDLSDIYKAIIDDLPLTAFQTTAKLRNTTGHNLAWDDIFENYNVYEKFFQQEVNAILYLIATKFL